METVNTPRKGLCLWHKKSLNLSSQSFLGGILHLAHKDKLAEGLGPRKTRAFVLFSCHHLDFRKPCLGFLRSFSLLRCKNGVSGAVLFPTSMSGIRSLHGRQLRRQARAAARAAQSDGCGLSLESSRAIEPNRILLEEQEGHLLKEGYISRANL